MRHVLITAGSKGLGKMMTDYFLKKGCSVTATYRSDKSRADQLVEMYKDQTRPTPSAATGCYGSRTNR